MEKDGDSVDSTEARDSHSVHDDVAQGWYVVVTIRQSQL